MTTNPRIAPVERAMHRSWDDWLAFLDGIGAPDLAHQQIAERVHAELDGAVESAGWWAQSVTVAYEQHVGRRLPGQRPDGTFQTSVSRATPRAMEELMDDWVAFAASDDEVRGLVDGQPRVSATDRRATWRARTADGASLLVSSEPKTPDAPTASLVVTVLGLPTPEAGDAARARWAGIVGRFLAAA